MLFVLILQVASYRDYTQEYSGAARDEEIEEFAGEGFQTGSEDPKKTPQRRRKDIGNVGTVGTNKERAVGSKRRREQDPKRAII